MAESDLDRHVEAVRRFNRRYTRHLGILNEGLLRSEFSLTEGRVLFEVVQGETPTATAIARALGIDAGYLSRILRRFERRRLIEKWRSKQDGRQSLLRLTRSGEKAIAILNARARDEVGAMLRALSPGGQQRVVGAMHTIGTLIGAEPERRGPYLLRPHQPGDMGWVVEFHGVLYTREYRWDDQFEGFVAAIVSTFLQRYDPKRERCWIAERDGVRVGSVFLVRHSKTVAQLRLLLVDPSARGLGIGTRLVSECVRFARHVGYRKIRLWTQASLQAARHIYEQAGFRLTRKQPHHSFGHDLIGETWELTL